MLKKEEDDEVREAHQPPPELNSIENGDPEWVNCPICGAQVRSDDGVINSHLGTNNVVVIMFFFFFENLNFLGEMVCCILDEEMIIARGCDFKNF